MLRKDGRMPAAENDLLDDNKWDDVKIELDKCELRCQEHHKQLRAAQHGTLARYSHGKCRCDECRLAWGVYQKEYKATLATSASPLS